MKKIFILLFAVFSLSLFSLDTELNIYQYVHKSFTTDDGLPINTINFVFQSKKGYLWIGTQNGLVVFDGINFKVIKKLSDNFRFRDVTGIAESKDGVMWISTYDGLVELKNNDFKVYTKKNGLRGNNLGSIFFDKNNNLWISYLKNKFNYYDGIKFVTPKLSKEIYDFGRLYYSYKDNLDELWFCTDNGLIHYDLYKWNKFTTRDGLISNKVTCIVQYKNEYYLIATSKGILRYEKGKFFKEKSIFHINFVRDMLFDKDGNLWIATESKGIYKISKGNIEGFNSENGLKGDLVFDLYEDNEGNIWISSYIGLDLLISPKIKVYTKKSGLLDNIIWGIHQDIYNNVWIVANNSLGLFKDGKFVNYTKSYGLKSNVVSSVVSDGNKLYVGTYDSWLNLINLDTFNVDIIKNNESANFKNSIRALYIDRDKNIWLGTYGNGLFLKKKNDSIFRHLNILKKHLIYYIYQNRDNDIWIGTDSYGVYRLKNNSIIGNITKNQGLSSNTILYIYEDKSGLLFFSNEEKGFDIYDPLSNKIVNISTEKGLIDISVYSILEDNGFLYLSGNMGITRIKRQEILDIFYGKRSKISDIFVFNKDDGLKELECNGGFQPSACKLNNGELWFPTIRGIAVIDPLKVKINKREPRYFIEKVIVDNNVYRKIVKEIRLKSSTKRIQLFFTSISFKSASRIKFKCKLEGFDNNWIEKRGKERHITYTNLSSGDYVFKLKSTNSDGIWSKSCIKLKLIIEKKLLEKTWFVVLIFFIFSIFSYLLISLLRNLYGIVKQWKEENYIKNYKIIKQIASGGMADIFLAYDKKSMCKERFVIKKIKKGLNIDEDDKIRFIVEGRIIDKISSPFIVKVIDRGEWNSFLYIVMEYIKGITLREKIEKESPLPINESIRIMIQILEALSTIHSNGIIHRDIKPENFMIRDKTNEVVMVDFGIAKMVDLSGITQTGYTLGTINYMAPEQLKKGETSFKSDIFSTGLIYYEMITGKKFMSGITTIEIINNILNLDLNVVSLNEIENMEIRKIIASMLNKAPELRPDAQYLLELLKGLI